jgi:large subunit ribosomal protein L22
VVYESLSSTMNVLSLQLPKFWSKSASNIRICVAPLNVLTTHTPYVGARSPSLSYLHPSLSLLSKTHVLNLSTSTKQQQVLSPVSPATITTEDSGEKLGIFVDTRNLPKLKPSIVQRRLSKCKTYEGREKNIRQSPWKLNRICQLAAGLTLEEALSQLGFCPLKNADLVAKVLRRTSNLADIRDGIQISQLEVAECFVTKSAMLRRVKLMGRGRYEIYTHRTMLANIFFLFRLLLLLILAVFPLSFLDLQSRYHASQVLTYSGSFERN